MKLSYPFAICAIAVTLFAQTSFAQTYSGGTYTAILSGDWHNNNPVSIWQTTEPPATCTDCHIIINDGVLVTLNTTVTLSGNSLLSIGTAGSAQTTTLTIPFSTTATPAPLSISYSRINLVYGDPASIALGNSAASINAGNTGSFDGVFLAVPTPMSYNPYFYIQRLGTSAPYPNSTVFNGPATLSSIGTLPIILSGFNARLNNGTVDLSWTTQLEINADYIAVERSADAGAHWSVIGRVAAHGNSATAENYSFPDSKPVAGTSEYRLRLVDKDAKYSYSEVRTIRNGLVTAVSIYPNPARDYVNLTLDGSPIQGAGAAQGVVIRLLNQSGQLLQEKMVNNAGGTIIPLAVGAYPPGNYLVVVTRADGSKQVSKLLISK